MRCVGTLSGRTDPTLPSISHLAHPPEWLITALGDRPADVAGVVTDNGTVHTIAEHLLRTGHDTLGRVYTVGAQEVWTSGIDVRPVQS
jgi:hypothetical protein